MNPPAIPMFPTSAEAAPAPLNIAPNWAKAGPLLAASIEANNKRVQRIQRSEVRRLAAIAAAVEMVRGTFSETQEQVFADTFATALRG